MKKILQICVVALVVVGMRLSAFAEENHCYPSLTNERGAGETNERGYKFHTGWAVLTRAMLYRSMFGLSGERNEDVIQFLADSLGCRFESQTAHAMKRTLDVELIKIRERYLREVEKGEHEEFFSELGALVAEVP
jgi:hypothetical protein